MRGTPTKVAVTSDITAGSTLLKSRMFTEIGNGSQCLQYIHKQVVEEFTYFWQNKLKFPGKMSDVTQAH
jgi:hypothetical protein